MCDGCTKKKVCLYDQYKVRANVVRDFSPIHFCRIQVPKISLSTVVSYTNTTQATNGCYKKRATSPILTYLYYCVSKDTDECTKYLLVPMSSMTPNRVAKLVRLVTTVGT